MYYAMVAVISAAIALQPTAGSRSLAFEDLTVPAKSLPAGCVLAPPPSAVSAGAVVLRGAWSSLLVPTNPWIGTDARLIVEIRERLEPIIVPDGPPLSPRDNARFRMKLAEDVEAAYAAVYSASPSRDEVAVYGLRFTTVGAAADFWRTVSRSKISGVAGVAVGPSVAFVTGDGGPCYQAVAAYVKSFAK